ncbi:uncharacterized protein [Eucyclogobius newberryi]|uniref:uncharacterized protein n=1 Tax=Eucyclogobius newberryi TaxID=166745 RepID=UPI003B5A46D6
MNMFRRERGQTPAVPPRPDPQDLENPVTHSKGQQDAVTVTTQTQRGGVMGAMQKVNPFRSSATATQAGVSKAPSSESLEDNVGSSAQNPGMFKGVMQKVNPFKSSTTTTTPTTQQVTKVDTTSDSVEAEKPMQSPGMMSGMMQRVNPFKSSSQAPKNELNRVSTEAQATDDAAQTKPNPGVISGMMQKVNPFKSSQPKRLHGDLSSSEGSLADNNNLQDKKASNQETPELPPRPSPQQVSLEADGAPVLPPRPNQQVVPESM